MSSTDNAKPLAIIGAGTYASPIAELAEACGYRVTHYLDDARDRLGQCIRGIPIQGPIQDTLQSVHRDTSIAVAIGNNLARLTWLRRVAKLGFPTPSLVSPQAIISPSAQIADAVYIHPGSHIWSNAELSFGTIVSPHATISHDTTMDVGCFASTGANVGASITIRPFSMLGMGSVVSTGVHEIAENTLVGAGSVIIRDTERDGVYAGCPGRLLRHQSSSNDYSAQEASPD